VARAIIRHGANVNVIADEESGMSLSAIASCSSTSVLCSRSIMNLIFAR